jgi:uncharacterized protein (DUF1330 family)
MINLLIALAASAAAPAIPGVPDPTICDNKPVLMVVAGPTHDRARMIAYGQAIADSKLYEKLGGYYVNVPQPLATFEGEGPKGYTTLIVRFPCLANARAFWLSREYQDKIIPLRRNPSAGDYVVTVYPEAAVRPDMVGKVGDNAYQVPFDASTVPQIPHAP